METDHMDHCSIRRKKESAVDLKEGSEKGDIQWDPGTSINLFRSVIICTNWSQLIHKAMVTSGLRLVGGMPCPSMYLPPLSLLLLPPLSQLEKKDGSKGRGNIYGRSVLN